MSLSRSPNLNRITPAEPSQFGLIRETSTLRTKRLTCKTCDGKVCVGRCRFEKTH